MRNTTSTSETTEQNARQKAIPSMAELDMRDYFAAKAMPSLLSTVTEFPDEHWRVGVAVDAYAMADAMLAAREGKAGGGAA